MRKTKNQGKPTMIQFAAEPKKKIIAVEPDGETKSTDSTDIPTMGSIQKGIDALNIGDLKIGDYFKVENKNPWKYYRKASAKGAKKLKEKDFENGVKKESIREKESIRDGLANLKLGEYFKVKNGNEFRYYKILSAKGVTKTTKEAIEEATKKANVDAVNTRTTTVTAIQTLVDEEAATTTTVDFMQGKITGSDVPLYIQNRDMIAVKKNTKFCVSQLVDTARIFKILVEYTWVLSAATYSTGTDSKLENKMLLRRDTGGEKGHHYHHKQTIGEFIRIFHDIDVEINKNGFLFTPQSQAYHTITLKYQTRIESKKSVIHMNFLKIALYNFLMRKTKKVEGRSNKLEAIKNKKEGLLLLVIACSIGLPTRKFTNAYDFFEIFSKKYTIVSDNNIIRTLLHLNGIYVDEVKEYGNRSLELWEIYKKEFPHFKTTYDDDDDKIKTLYSYPTATELRYLVIRAEKVIENILDGNDLVETVEQGKKQAENVVQKVEKNIINVDTVEGKKQAANVVQKGGKKMTDPDTEEAPKRNKMPKRNNMQVKQNPNTSQKMKPMTNEEIAEADTDTERDDALFTKKPLNFLLSI